MQNSYEIDKSTKIKSNVMLFLTAFIWGSAFVAQSIGMEYVGPFTFIVTRFIIGGLVLIPVYSYSNKKNPKAANAYDKKTTLTGGILCGILLFGASACQQVGIMTTTAGKAGFITSLYIVLVPIFALFIKQKVNFAVWISVAIATAGLYLLCIKEGFTIGGGDILIIMCAVIFSIHMLLLGKYSQTADCVKMASIQFIVCGLCAVPFMLITEKIVLANILAAWLPILYAGLLSSGVGYTLQILALKNIKPEIASIVLSLESVFAALCGWILLNETMSTKELIGCLLMFVSVVLAQIPTEKKNN